MLVTSTTKSIERKKAKNRLPIKVLIKDDRSMIVTSSKFPSILLRIEMGGISIINSFPLTNSISPMFVTDIKVAARERSIAWRPLKSYRPTSYIRDSITPIFLLELFQSTLSSRNSRVQCDCRICNIGYRTHIYVYGEYDQHG